MTLEETAKSILDRYRPPPLDIHEFRARMADAVAQRRDPNQLVRKRMLELQQSVLQAMADPDWKRHPELSRAYFDAGSSRIQIDGWSMEVIAWEDRLAANGLTEAPQ